MKILETINLNKHFINPIDFHVLKDVTFSLEEGEFVSIVGKSGCGKSTLLYLLSTMDTDYTGKIFIDSVELTQKKSIYLSNLRNEKIGFVFQFHYLLPEFTALENVMLPALKLKKYSYKKVRELALEKLTILGIEKEYNKVPNMLSGGQKQRVAIARALINEPKIIMGDEPTGNLDSQNTENVFDIFKKISREQKQTILVVTHDNDFSKKTDRIITMEDGKII